MKCLKAGVEPKRGHPNETQSIPGSVQQDNPPLPTITPPPQANLGVPTINLPPQSIAFAPPPPQSVFPTPSSNMYQPAPSDIRPFVASTVAGGTKARSDPKNPFNAEGKIRKNHPKFFEVLSKAERSVDHAIKELKFNSGLKGKDLLEEAAKYLNSLEE